MFTIELKRKEKDEKFEFKDLEMFHQECSGGQIKTSIEKGGIEDYARGLREFVMLTCKRCGLKSTILLEERIEVIKTAIDGIERKIGKDLRVIRKN